MKHRFLIAILLIAAFRLSVPQELSAQIWNDVRIVHVDVSSFPSIRVHVRVFCAGRQTSNFNYVTTILTEDGVRQSATVNCPTETVPVSVAMALDRSGSVAGTSLYRIKEGALRFIELMQTHTTGQDEAAIISFGDDVRVDQGMTTNFIDLYDAIAGIWPYGVTTMYDAVIAALNEVANKGTNGIRAVIVLSDGGENNSAATFTDVIEYARNLNIPIYSIALSYYDSPEDLSRMKKMADSTGGQYIVIEHPDHIVPAFNSMMSRITGGANDCIFEYWSECPDGTWRDLKIIAHACGLTDTAYVRFRVPLDPNLPAVRVWFDSTSAYANGDLYLPVMIDVEGGGMIEKLKFKALERPPLTFREIITDGYLAEWMQVDHGVLGDSLIVLLRGPVMVNGPSTLLKIRYTAADVHSDSTYWYPLFSVEKETDDCRRLEVENTQFTLLKRPVLDVTCDDSLYVEWDEQSGRYINGIVSVGVTAMNRGNIAASNTRARVVVPYGMELLSPSDTILIGSSLAAGEYGRAEFLLRILPVDSSKTFVVCVEVWPDSGAVAVCCTRITVERAKSLLETICSMPDRIVWSDSLNSYVPEVFPVTVTVTNRSELAASNIEAWIHVPPGFAVDSTTPVNTFISPSTLTKSDTGSVTWLVRPLERPQSEILRFCVKVAAGLDTSECCMDMFISKSPVRAELKCTDTKILVYDGDTHEYQPSRFFVQTTVTNISALIMSTARGRVTLPPFLKLVDGEFLSKDFPGGAVLAPGDSATIRWVVEAVGEPLIPAEVCIDITATNFPGARCCIPIEVETVNAIPLLACELDGPDTIRYVDDGYQPNPMDISVTVRNIGDTPAKQVYAALLQGADLSIDDSDQALKLVADTLEAGEEVESGFRIRILDRGESRFDTIRVSVYAANGGGLVCEKIIFIEAVRAPVLVLHCLGPDSLVFSDSLNTYLPSPFFVGLQATNMGNAPADSIVAEFLAPPNIELITGEQAAKLLDPSRLEIGERGTASWLVNALNRDEARMDTIRVQVRSKGKSQQPPPCPVIVYIPSVRKAELDLACDLLDDIRVEGSSYVPDPFRARLLIRNLGDARAFDVRATVQFGNRLKLAPGETIVKTEPVIDALTGEVEFVWQMSALPMAVDDSIDICFRVTVRFQPEQFCCTKVFLPALGESGIATSCSTVDTLRVDEQSGSYPNPVTVTALVSNPTSVAVDSVRATILLPNGVELAAGETPDRLLRDLEPSDVERLEWQVNFLRDTATVIRDRRIRLQFFSGGNIQYCDMTVVVMPAPRLEADMSITCAGPDTLWYRDDGYKPDPAAIYTQIFNIGSADLTGVTGNISLPTGFGLDQGETAIKSLGADLEPGNDAVLSWNVVVLPSLDTGRYAVTIIVTSDNGPLRTCSKWVQLMRDFAADSVSMSLACTSPDSIRFNHAHNSLEPSPLNVRVEITNTGQVTLDAVQATLLLPQSVTFVAGEQDTKPLGVSLAAGQSASISWLCIPMETVEDRTVEFEIRVASDQSSEQQCITTTAIEGVVRVVSLNLTDDNVGSTGSIVPTPVFYSNNTGAQVFHYSFVVEYDHTAVEYDDIETGGTLSRNWNDVQARVESPGSLLVTASSSAPLGTYGVLLYLKWHVIFGLRQNENMGVRQFPLNLDEIAFDGVEVVSMDGMMTVSGYCIEPLKSEHPLALFQNSPNPFNPLTVIEYEVADFAAPATVTLVVHDAFGRLIRTLDEGVKGAGRHSVSFDASGLPSGVYFYRLRSADLVLQRKMLLTK